VFKSCSNILGLAAQYFRLHQRGRDIRDSQPPIPSQLIHRAWIWQRWLAMTIIRAHAVMLSAAAPIGSVLLAGRRTTFFAQQYHRAARHVALHGLSVARHVVLCGPCAVPGVVQCALSAVLDAAPYQTAFRRVACWSGLQRVTPLQPRARPQFPAQQYIPKEQERSCDSATLVSKVHPSRPHGRWPLRHTLTVAFSASPCTQGQCGR
jgi:hypothetical protein